MRKFLIFLFTFVLCIYVFSPSEKITKIAKRPAFKKKKAKAKRVIKKKSSEKDDTRTKMGLEDLDRELDAYMKSSKHPRVEPTEEMQSAE